MALPAIKALSSIYELHIIGPRWVTELYPTFARFFYSPNPKPLCSSIALFKPSFGSAWRARHYQRKIGIDNGLRRHLLTVRCHGGNHRIDQFNSIAQALHAQPNLVPQFSPNTADIPTLPTDFNLCIVGTNSAETVQWKQFPELARQLSQQSIFLGGPGDEHSLETLGAGHRCLPVELSLVQVATVARKANYIIGLDSGLTHLAIAARNYANIPAEHDIVIYGSTSPQQTGPRNSISIYNDRPACWPCYQKRCSVNTPCLQTSVDSILERLS